MAQRYLVLAKIWPFLREILIVVVAALAGIVAYGWVVGPRQVSQMAGGAKPPSTLAIGTELKVSHANFRGSPLSVILVTSPNCPHCRASAKFHRDVLMQCAKRGIRMFVAVPKLQESQKYIKSASLQSAELRTWHDLNVYVAAAPALIMVDAEGLIRRVFVGELPPNRRSDIFDIIANPSRLETPIPFTSTGERNLNVKEFEAISTKPGTFLLDVRERVDFARGHLAAATNIPLEELTVRAAFELKHDKLHVVDCSAIRDTTCQYAVDNLAAQSFRTAALNAGLAFGSSCATVYP